MKKNKKEKKIKKSEIRVHRIIALSAFIIWEYIAISSSIGVFQMPILHTGNVNTWWEPGLFMMHLLIIASVIIVPLYIKNIMRKNEKEQKRENK